MERIVLWGAFLWHCSCQIQGLQHVFVLHGNDLHLGLEKPVVLNKKTDLFWKFNTINNVAKCSFNNGPVVFDKYEGRAELHGQNYSLLLKKVKHSDSGNYSAIVVGGQDQTVAEYNVTIQDRVSPVNLAVKSVSSSCVHTVTCSTVDSRIHRTFRCDSKNCSQVEENSFKGTNYHSSLIVYMQQNSINCNHSNHVSWEQSKITPDCKTVSNRASIIQISASLGLVFLSAFSAFCIVTK
ncbi:uncharacterized protein LOC115796466 [Archocentrus centrarchus]|uniref:uncharacterized protein LOC115796466 n=1 Tax=Archocentrus centrarchus TaxID=63155 RepID=UPI0011E9D28C|nr:uncharacterized protein LOC115796466 [Archocentrus centrarchus]